ncbi:hypothetical protein HBB16_21400 [Pseudonocardia sp. MCCB 268]|nr:hypothetical protein [Pseudonocardia cytotoxica]
MFADAGRIAGGTAVSTVSDAVAHGWRRPPRSPPPADGPRAAVPAACRGSSRCWC